MASSDISEASNRVSGIDILSEVKSSTVSPALWDTQAITELSEIPSRVRLTRQDVKLQEAIESQQSRVPFTPSHRQDIRPKQGPTLAPSVFLPNVTRDSSRQKPKQAPSPAPLSSRPASRRKVRPVQIQTWERRAQNMKRNESVVNREGNNDIRNDIVAKRCVEGYHGTRNDKREEGNHSNIKKCLEYYQRKNTGNCSENIHNELTQGLYTKSEVSRNREQRDVVTITYAEWMAKLAKTRKDGIDWDSYEIHESPVQENVKVANNMKQDEAGLNLQEYSSSHHQDKGNAQITSKVSEKDNVTSAAGKPSSQGKNSKVLNNRELEKLQQVSMGVDCSEISSGNLSFNRRSDVKGSKTGQEGHVMIGPLLSRQNEQLKTPGSSSDNYPDQSERIGDRYQEKERVETKKREDKESERNRIPHLKDWLEIKMKKLSFSPRLDTTEEQSIAEREKPIKVACFDKSDLELHPGTNNVQTECSGTRKVAKSNSFCPESCFDVPLTGSISTSKPFKNDALNKTCLKQSPSKFFKDSSRPGEVFCSRREKVEHHPRKELTGNSCSEDIIKDVVFLNNPIYENHDDTKTESQVFDSSGEDTSLTSHSFHSLLEIFQKQEQPHMSCKISFNKPCSQVKDLSIEKLQKRQNHQVFEKRPEPEGREIKVSECDKQHNTLPSWLAYGKLKKVEQQGLDKETLMTKEPNHMVQEDEKKNRVSRTRRNEKKQDQWNYSDVPETSFKCVLPSCDVIKPWVADFDTRRSIIDWNNLEHQTSREMEEKRPLWLQHVLRKTWTTEEDQDVTMFQGASPVVQECGRGQNKTAVDKSGTASDQTNLNIDPRNSEENVKSGAVEDMRDNSVPVNPATRKLPVTRLEINQKKEQRKTGASSITGQLEFVPANAFVGMDSPINPEPTLSPPVEHGRPPKTSEPTSVLSVTHGKLPVSLESIPSPSGRHSRPSENTESTPASSVEHGKPPINPEATPSPNVRHGRPAENSESTPAPSVRHGKPPISPEPTLSPSVKHDSPPNNSEPTPAPSFEHGKAPKSPEQTSLSTDCSFITLLNGKETQDVNHQINNSRLESPVSDQNPGTQEQIKFVFLSGRTPLTIKQNNRKGRVKAVSGSRQHVNFDSSGKAHWFDDPTEYCTNFDIKGKNECERLTCYSSVTNSSRDTAQSYKSPFKSQFRKVHFAGASLNARSVAFTENCSTESMDRCGHPLSNGSQDPQFLADDTRREGKEIRSAALSPAVGYGLSEKWSEPNDGENSTLFAPDKLSWLEHDRQRESKEVICGLESSYTKEEELASNFRNEDTRVQESSSLPDDSSEAGSTDSGIMVSVRGLNTGNLGKLRTVDLLQQKQEVGESSEKSLVCQVNKRISANLVSQEKPEWIIKAERIRMKHQSSENYKDCYHDGLDDLMTRSTNTNQQNAYEPKAASKTYKQLSSRCNPISKRAANSTGIPENKEPEWILKAKKIRNRCAELYSEATQEKELILMNDNSQENSRTERAVSELKNLDTHNNKAPDDRTLCSTPIDPSGSIFMVTKRSREENIANDKEDISTEPQLSMSAKKKHFEQKISERSDVRVDLKGQEKFTDISVNVELTSKDFCVFPPPTVDEVEYECVTVDCRDAGTSNKLGETHQNLVVSELEFQVLQDRSEGNEVQTNNLDKQNKTILMPSQKDEEVASSSHILELLSSGGVSNQPDVIELQDGPLPSLIGISTAAQLNCNNCIFPETPSQRYNGIVPLIPQIIQEESEKIDFSEPSETPDIKNVYCQTNVEQFGVFPAHRNVKDIFSQTCPESRQLDVKDSLCPTDTKEYYELSNLCQSENESQKTVSKMFDNNWGSHICQVDPKNQDTLFAEHFDTSYVTKDICSTTSKFDDSVDLNGFHNILVRKHNEETEPPSSSFPDAFNYANNKVIPPTNTNTCHSSNFHLKPPYTVSNHNSTTVSSTNTNTCQSSTFHFKLPNTLSNQASTTVPLTISNTYCSQSSDLKAPNTKSNQASTTVPLTSSDIYCSQSSDLKVPNTVSNQASTTVPLTSSDIYCSQSSDLKLPNTVSNQASTIVPLTSSDTYCSQSSDVKVPNNMSNQTSTTVSLTSSDTYCSQSSHLKAPNTVSNQTSTIVPLTSSDTYCSQSSDNKVPNNMSNQASTTVSLTSSNTYCSQSFDLKAPNTVSNQVSADFTCSLSALKQQETPGHQKLLEEIRTRGKSVLSSTNKHSSRRQATTKSTTCDRKLSKPQMDDVLQELKKTVSVTLASSRTFPEPDLKVRSQFGYSDRPEWMIKVEKFSQKWESSATCKPENPTKNHSWASKPKQPSLLQPKTSGRLTTGETIDHNQSFLKWRQNKSTSVSNTQRGKRKTFTVAEQTKDVVKNPLWLPKLSKFKRRSIDWDSLDKRSTQEPSKPDWISGIQLRKVSNYARWHEEEPTDAFQQPDCARWHEEEPTDAFQQPDCARGQEEKPTDAFQQPDCARWQEEKPTDAFQQPDCARWQEEKPTDAFQQPDCARWQEEKPTDALQQPDCARWQEEKPTCAFQQPDCARWQEEKPTDAFQQPDCARWQEEKPTDAFQQPDCARWQEEKPTDAFQQPDCARWQEEKPTDALQQPDCARWQEEKPTDAFQQPYCARWQEEKPTDAFQQPDCARWQEEKPTDAFQQPDCTKWQEQEFTDAFQQPYCARWQEEKPTDAFQQPDCARWQEEKPTDAFQQPDCARGRKEKPIDAFQQPDCARGRKEKPIDAFQQPDPNAAHDLSENSCLVRFQGVSDLNVWQIEDTSKKTIIS
ncbi:uncharacterized protein LOC143244162 [Tachypleus tridentatus]|uniref:uncharacterized protein LOC143244162 n=1 Tax=Tachypleus tridentatus TaxID=6853 RepID=UPI003FD64D8C